MPKIPLFVIIIFICVAVGTVIVNQRLQTGGFKDAEEVIIQALKSSPAAETPAAASAAQKPLREKTLVELCDPIRGLMDDIDFSRNPSTARPLDL